MKINVLDLTYELNLAPKRVAATKGGEYKSKCPNCQDGKDRFCLWPNQGESGRYWCRVCGCGGDGIQFCRDFLGMTYHQACQKVHVAPRFQEKIFSNRPFRMMKFVPQAIQDTTSLWRQAATDFIVSSQKKLMNNSAVLNLLLERGLSRDTIHQFSLGWNPDDLFDKKEKWGLASCINENGLLRRVWLPRGIVIPSYTKNEPIKMKIRRTEWRSDDRYLKYVEVSGSASSLSVYGDISKPIIIVESELDAILIQQSASHLVCSLALGGVSKKT